MEPHRGMTPRRAPLRPSHPPGACGGDCSVMLQPSAIPGVHSSSPLVLWRPRLMCCGGAGTTKTWAGCRARSRRPWCSRTSGQHTLACPCPSKIATLSRWQASKLLPPPPIPPTGVPCTIPPTPPATSYRFHHVVFCSVLAHLSFLSIIDSAYYGFLCKLECSPVPAAVDPFHWWGMPNNCCRAVVQWGRYLWMHNGVIGGFMGLRRALLATLSEVRSRRQMHLRQHQLVVLGLYQIS